VAIFKAHGFAREDVIAELAKSPIFAGRSHNIPRAFLRKDFFQQDFTFFLKAEYDLEALDHRSAKGTFGG
jgi:hypothetical protein